MQLIIAAPSPYARKARIALLEKGIAFDTVIDNPWLPGTAIGKLNPLAKVPALITDDGEVIHDSSVIVEYVDTLRAEPRLIPADPRQRVAVKQIEALADGVCDAVVLSVLERNRKPEQQNAAWLARQQRKVEAGVDALSTSLGQRSCFTDTGFGLAEISCGCALGYLDLRYVEFDWRAGRPNLLALFDALSTRESFAQTKPVAQPMPQQS